MNGDFKFLQKFVFRDFQGEPNWFIPLHSSEVDTFEKAHGIRFPEDLRKFYEQIGYGFLRRNKDGKPNETSGIQNLIMAPSQIEIVLDEESDKHPMEGFGGNEIPILDLGDQSYLVLRFNSEHRCTGVYWPEDDKVAESFEDLVNKMFFKDVLYFEVD